ncbi:ILEU-like protein [Mya arenaria]|uniref:ILEU-like protein n=1 Tax=Mya arenaria TaxID=6604 RepID=A0ABY7E1E5_MYAAR|nr:ILEU-like protein [Mya arenaria]
MASRKRTVVSDSASEFSLDIYKAITSSSNNDNLFIAPTSIWIAMAMVNVGARNVTREQIEAALKLRFKDEEVMLDEFEKFSKVLNQGNRKSVKLQVANRLYPYSGRTILPKYISTISQHFGTDVKPLDFKSRISINNWVEEVTEQKIKNVLLTL